MQKTILLTIVLGMAAAMTAPAMGQRKQRRGGTYPPELPGAKVEVYKTIGDVKLNMYLFTPEGHKPARQGPGHRLLLRRRVAEWVAQTVPETV